VQAGQVLLISGKTLHQVHIWLFLIATFHVATSIAQILLSELLVRLLWRRWERAAVGAEAAIGLAPDGAAALCPAPLNGEGVKGADQAPDGAAAQLEPATSGETDMENGAAAAGAAAAEDRAGQGAEGCVMAAAAAAGGAWRRLRLRWRFRRAAQPQGHGLLLEGAICLLQALSPLIGALPAQPATPAVPCTCLQPATAQLQRQHPSPSARPRCSHAH
jgi:hypothetical protein